MIRYVLPQARLARSHRYVRRLCAAASTISGRALIPTRTKQCPPHNFRRVPTAPSRRYTQGASGELSPFNGETIYALSTGSGRAAIAIIRISGPACDQVCRALCPDQTLPKYRYTSVRTLRDPSDPKIILDTDALVLRFAAPRTATGEDILELHIHGGPATVKAVLSAISRVDKQPMIRAAAPGEFTRRAFQLDRLDLAQVEALSDTLSAETEQQRRAALRGHTGVLGRTYDGWREQLLAARGELEALIDFSEDQHFDDPMQLLTSVKTQVVRMQGLIRSHELGARSGQLLRKGIQVSLLGLPNAGKSSLFNRIVGKDASIVNKQAGTTRDIVEATVDIGGYLCSFADTAGLRDSGTDRSESRVGEIEEEGIRRAKAKGREADLVIMVLSVEARPGTTDITLDIDPDVLSILKGNFSTAETKPAIIVINKCEKASQENLGHAIQGLKDRLSHQLESIPPMICISVAAAEAALLEPTSDADPGNIGHFTNTLLSVFKDMTHMPVEMEDLVGVTERQRQLLVTSSGYLDAFVGEANVTGAREPDIVIAAEHLRAAAVCLSQITGRGDAGNVEEVLGVIFEKFCVGK